MMRPHGIGIGLLVLGTLGLALVGCGDSDSASEPRVAAQVGDTQITVQQLQREDRNAKRYIKIYRTFRQSPRTVLQALIREEWARQEAVARGVELPTQRVSRADLRTYVTEQLRNAVIAKKRFPVSSAQVRAFFAAHRSELADPAHRLVIILEARTMARAQKAARALRAGEDAAEVRARFGGGVPNVTGDRTGLSVVYQGQEQLPPGLERAVFRAPRDEVAGPVKAGSIWYVLRVEQAARAVPPQLERRRKDITTALQAARVTRYFQRFLESLAEKYRPTTRCSKPLLVPECANGPSSKGA